MKRLKHLLLSLWLAAFGALQSSPLILPAAQTAGTVAIASAPSLTPAALAGATAIVAVLAEDGEAVTIHALNWEQDNNPFSTTNFIQLLWDGADLLPREEHTAIWRINHHQQDGYYAVFWHAPNDGAWDAGDYSYGTHPYPVATDCDVDGNGNAANFGGSTGTIHCFEEAGLQDGPNGTSPGDYLATAGASAGVLLVPDRWYTQVRRVRLMTSGPHNGEYEHRFIPDLEGDPTFEIVVYVTSIGSGGANPANYFGVSDWSTNGSGGSEETLAGKLRGIQMYDAYLSDADMALEAANQYSNTPVTSAGLANVWYMNQDPTVSDVTDKSGAGHDPSWGNSNRPTDWDSTYTTGGWGVFGANDIFLLKAGF